MSTTTGPTAHFGAEEPLPAGVRATMRGMVEAIELRGEPGCLPEMERWLREHRFQIVSLLPAGPCWVIVGHRG